MLIGFHMGNMRIARHANRSFRISRVLIYNACGIPTTTRTNNDCNQFMSKDQPYHTATAPVHLLHLFQQPDSIQDFPFTRLFNLPRKHIFIQNTVNLVKIEDNIQLANIAKVTIQQFYKQMHRLEITQLIIRKVHRDCEE